MSVLTDNLGDNEDIYRGDPPGSDPSIHFSSSASSSSSSSSSLAAGRLGAIATKLELAISRWARGVRRNSSDASDASSTSSSSSSSSRSSVVTLTKSQLARRKRRRSMSSLRSTQSEREIAARITRMKALERSRQIPREFGLYLPPSMNPPALQLPPHFSQGKEYDRGQRMIWTTNLSLILSQLDLASRKSAKQRRVRGKQRESADDISVMETSAAFLPAFTPRYRGSSVPPSKSVSYLAGGRIKKGKNRAMPKPASTLPSMHDGSQTKPEAWFLDVGNPTWSDLKAIGKLLHIHPLTLEDILQQDPREKLELFNRLGYYFISFRAIESQEIREKFRRETVASDPSGNKLAIDDGFIGAANVYLTIFQDGICCFHFTDISEHTNRVRARLVLFEQVMKKSSEWITHGILDSIVDSFFPFLEEIEKEVMAIDHVVYAGPSEPLPSEFGIELSNAVAKAPPRHDSVERKSGIFPLNEEKHLSASKLRESFRPRFASPRLTIRLLLRRAKRHILHSWTRLWARSEPPPSSIQLNLRRMARARKLVTILSRLLATKSEVIARIRKRLSVNASGRQTGEELELSIYMGDVQDHILTLQHSLAYYEHVLSQSHPTYLSQIRSMSEAAKSGADKKLLYLTFVTLSVLCILTLTGLFSMNVTIPRNQRAPGHPHNWFYVILVLSAMIVLSLLCVVRRWYKAAKRRHGRPL